MISINLHKHYYSHFTDEEIKVQWADVSGPKNQLERDKAGTDLKSV